MGSPERGAKAIDALNGKELGGTRPDGQSRPGLAKSVPVAGGGGWWAVAVDTWRRRWRWAATVIDQ